MRPDDVVQGSDPSFTTEVQRVPGFAATCSCGWSRLGQTNDEAESLLASHGRFAHPAYRNPDIGCQATPPWDHERWCIRPKGHDGDHWTPDFAEGRRWPS